MAFRHCECGSEHDNTPSQRAAHKRGAVHIHWRQMDVFISSEGWGV